MKRSHVFAGFVGVLLLTGFGAHRMAPVDPRAVDGLKAEVEE